MYSFAFLCISNLRLILFDSRQNKGAWFPAQLDDDISAPSGRMAASIF